MQTLFNISTSYFRLNLHNNGKGLWFIKFWTSSYSMLQVLYSYSRHVKTRLTRKFCCQIPESDQINRKVSTHGSCVTHNVCWFRFTSFYQINFNIAWRITVLVYYFTESRVESDHTRLDRLHRNSSYSTSPAFTYRPQEPYIVTIFLISSPGKFLDDTSNYTTRPELPWFPPNLLCGGYDSLSRGYSNRGVAFACTPSIDKVNPYSANVENRGAPNSIPIYIQQDATLHSLFISGNCSTCSGGIFTHHQGRIQLYLQHLVFVAPSLLSAAIVEELEPVSVCCGWLTPPTAHSNRFQLFHDSGR
jgi:hypothetical protein